MANEDVAGMTRREAMLARRMAYDELDEAASKITEFLSMTTGPIQPGQSTPADPIRSPEDTEWLKPLAEQRDSANARIDAIARRLAALKRRSL